MIRHRILLATFFITLLSLLAHADAELSDRDSSVEAKKIAVTAAKIAVAGNLLATAAFDTENYELGMRAIVLSHIAKGLTVTSVLMASEGRTLKDDAKKELVGLFSALKDKKTEAIAKWQALPNLDKAKHQVTWEHFQQNLKDLESNINALTIRR